MDVAFHALVESLNSGFVGSSNERLMRVDSMMDWSSACGKTASASS